MIVLDASVVVELLTDPAFAAPLLYDAANGAGPVIVPHLLDVEVVSALRRIFAAARNDMPEFEDVLTKLTELPATRYPHTPLLGRVWELRHNFTAYDAIYIALAEEMGSVLYTTDAKLRRGHRAQVRVLG